MSQFATVSLSSASIVIIVIVIIVIKDSLNRRGGKLSILTFGLENNLLGLFLPPDASKLYLILLFFNANGHWQHILIISSSLHDCLKEFLKIL